VWHQNIYKLRHIRNKGSDDVSFGYRRGKTEKQIGSLFRFARPFKILTRNKVRKTFSKNLDNALLTLVLVYFFVNQPGLLLFRFSGKGN